MKMNVEEAAKHFKVDRRTILSICNNDSMIKEWRVSWENGRWYVNHPMNEPVYKPESLIGLIVSNKTNKPLTIWGIYKLCERNIISNIKVGKSAVRIPYSEFNKLINYMK